MNKQQSLAIIGCGWLGRHMLTPLAQSFALSATTSRQHTAEALAIPAFVYDWRKDTLPKALLKAKHYLIAIPPTAGGYDHYADNMARLASELAHQESVIMISSSGIYPKEPGQYDENSAIDENNAIYQGENALKSELEHANILRCSGLFGDDRLTGKQYYHQSNTMTNKRLNLIHYQDIAQAILALLRAEKTKTVFNLAHPEHPLRHTYYTAQAKLRDQPKPLFVNQEVEADRIIDGSQIEKTLDFRYRYAPTQSL